MRTPPLKSGRKAQRCAEHYAEQAFRIEKDSDGRKSPLQNVARDSVILDEAPPCGVTLLLRVVRPRERMTLLLESPRVRHAANEFSQRFLTRREAKPDDARGGNEIAQAILIWIGDYQSFRMILLGRCLNDRVANR